MNDHDSLVTANTVVEARCQTCGDALRVNKYGDAFDSRGSLNCRVTGTAHVIVGE